MCIVDRQRAYYIVATRDIKDIHGIVYRHAARSAMTRRNLDKTSEMCELGNLSSKTLKIDEKGRIWRGFENRNIPNTWYAGIQQTRDHHDITPFFPFWESTFPGEDTMKLAESGRREDILHWKSTANTRKSKETDREISKRGRCRYSTTNFGMTASIELCTQNRNMLR